MIRRGLTHIEVLLSLTLLSVLAIATVSWTASTATIESERSRHSEQTTQEVLLERLIHIDLANDDLSLPASIRRESRVWLTSDSLHILTRDAGASEVRYRFDPITGVLSRMLFDLGSETARRVDPVLTGSSDLRWAAVRNEDQGVGFISVSWIRPDHSPASFEVETPLEWLP